MREKYLNIQLVVIDEFTMINMNIFCEFDKNARMVFNNSDVPFGGKSILLVGDVNQLPAVCAHSLWPLPPEIRARRLIEKESLFSHLVSVNNSRQPDQNDLVSVQTRGDTVDSIADDPFF